MENKMLEVLEGIKRELELQNDLKMYDMLHDKEGYNHACIKSDINDMTKGKLYARLSDEDRSIIERYKKASGGGSEELRFYDMTVRGFSSGYSVKGIQYIIGRMHNEILNDVYTEKELYEYFERVFERTDSVLKPLDYYWEKAWQNHEVEKLDDKGENDFQLYYLWGYDEETWKKRTQKFMEMYENRITKAYAEEQKQYE